MRDSTDASPSSSSSTTVDSALLESFYQIVQQATQPWLSVPMYDAIKDEEICAFYYGPLVSLQAVLAFLRRCTDSDDIQQIKKNLKMVETAIFKLPRLLPLSMVAAEKREEILGKLARVKKYPFIVNNKLRQSDLMEFFLLTPVAGDEHGLDLIEAYLHLQNFDANKENLARFRTVLNLLAAKAESDALYIEQFTRLLLSTRFLKFYQHYYVYAEEKFAASVDAGETSHPANLWMMVQANFPALLNFVQHNLKEASTEPSLDFSHPVHKLLEAEKKPWLSDGFQEFRAKLLKDAIDMCELYAKNYEKKQTESTAAALTEEYTKLAVNMRGQMEKLRKLAVSYEIPLLLASSPWADDYKNLPSTPKKPRWRQSAPTTGKKPGTSLTKTLFSDGDSPPSSNLLVDLSSPSSDGSLSPGDSRRPSDASSSPIQCLPPKRLEFAEEKAQFIFNHTYGSFKQDSDSAKQNEFLTQLIATVHDSLQKFNNTLRERNKNSCFARFFNRRHLFRGEQYAQWLGESVTVDCEQTKPSPQGKLILIYALLASTDGRDMQIAVLQNLTGVRINWRNFRRERNKVLAFLREYFVDKYKLGGVNSKQRQRFNALLVSPIIDCVNFRKPLTAATTVGQRHITERLCAERLVEPNELASQRQQRQVAK